PRPVGDGVMRLLPGPDVVEGSGPDYVQSRIDRVLEAGQVGGGLAGGVGIGGSERTVLVPGSARRIAVAVDQAAAHVEDSGPASPANHGVVQRPGGVQVAGPGSVGLVGRFAGVGVAGQVVDLLGPGPAQDLFDGGGRAEIAGVQLDFSRQVL